MRGKSFSLARARETHPVVAGRNVFPPDRGSLEFWMQPTDWNNFFIGDYLGTNIPRMTLLHVGPVAGPPQHALGLSIALGRAGAVADAPFVQIHPGAWTHVLCTWGPAGPGVYLNGLPQPMAQIGLHGDAGAMKNYKEWREKTKKQDDGAWGLVLDQSGTLIDELRVYDRQLNPMEAANAFARYFPDAGERLAKLPLIGATYAYFAYRPETHISLACLPVGGVDPATAKVVMTTPSASKPVYTSEPFALTADGVVTIKAPLALEFLPYDVQIESFGPDGKSLHKAASKYVREKPDWWQNDLGKARVVPKPWTPIVVKAGEKEKTLDIWGRTITLDATGLPAQVKAVGEEVLAGAPRMQAKVNGAEVSFAGKGATMGEAAPDLAAWRGAMAAAGIDADVDASIEFDGLMKFAVTLKSNGASPAKVDRLTLDFPIREAHGQQLIVNGGHNNFRASYDVRLVPQGTGRVWDSKNSKPGMPKAVAVGHFCPMVWIGDDERGLCFFGENDKGWTPNPAEPAQEILRADGSVTYRMNVITLPVTLDKPREFVFYVLPTPSKPLQEDWRAYNRAPQKQPLSAYDAIDDFCGFPLTEKYVGTPTSLTFALEPTNWEDAAKWRKFGKDKFGAQNPIWKYICASWPKLGPTMDDYRAALFWTGRLAWTREVEDYYVWTMCQYLERDMVDGIYIDDVSFASTLLEQCGAYTLPDGKTQPGFGSLGLRRFFKRLWIYMDQHGKRTHIMPHMTWCFELPAFSFIESGLNGEDRTIPPNAEHTFIDLWSRDEMRVMGGGKKFGFTTLWIPEIKTDNPMSHKLDAWVWRQSRAMHALALQHDFWYLFTYPSGRFISPPMTDFGIYEKEVKFVPYFNLGGAAVVKSVTSPSPPSGEAPAAQPKPPQPGQVLVSFWTRPSQGKALMLVSNLAKFEQLVTVEIDAAKLLGKAGEVVFRDVDSSIEPPVSQTASKTEMAAAEKNLLKDVPQLGAKQGEPTLDGFSLEDERDKKKAAYAIQTQGSAATLQVRGNDFRIVEVRLK
ncbi:MAG: DUF6067 family protein [Planctomycetota bacterium]|nr:DUF6067 family protein [Planctomycetota bacterium]